MATNVSYVKDQEQRNALNYWWTANGIGTLELATGVGKTRCGVLASALAVERLQTPKILILAPTRTIRDRVWEKEFTVWGLSEIYKKFVHTECIQTAYQWVGKTFDLVIVDEIHNSLTQEYSRFYENNTYRALLGLSATIPEGKRQRLNEIAPTCYRITTSEALRKGLVSPYRIYNVAISLTPEERKNYQSASRVIDELQEQGYAAWNPISLRKTILHGAVNKMAATMEIASWFPNKYGFVFAQYKKDVEEIAFALGKRAQYYHSGLKRYEEKKILEDFCNIAHPVNVLTSAKRLNEGADFPYVSFAIIHAGTSSDLVQTQQLGRIIRVEEGKQALLFRLYVKGTQDESWLRQAQRTQKDAPTYVSSVEDLKESLIDCAIL